MPIDIHVEDLAPLTRAGNLWIPTRPNVSTIWRWSTRGIRGHKLEVVRIGGVTCTSREAVTRFLSAINGRDVSPSVTSKQREQEIAHAERELAAAGIK